MDDGSLFECDNWIGNGSFHDETYKTAIVDGKLCWIVHNALRIHTILHETQIFAQWRLTSELHIVCSCNSTVYRGYTIDLWPTTFQIIIPQMWWISVGIITAGALSFKCTAIISMVHSPIISRRPEERGRRMIHEIVSSNTSLRSATFTASTKRRFYFFFFSGLRSRLT